MQETQETRIRSLGREGPLEKEMATHSSILAWKIPWTMEPGGLHTVHGVAKSWTRLTCKQDSEERGINFGEVRERKNQLWGNERRLSGGSKT